MKMAFSIKGIVERGFGEGAYFVSMEHYKREIEEKLGFSPYPGTLNLKVGKKEMLAVKKIASIKLSEFSSTGKKFGGVDCCRASVGKIKGAIIIPDLTRHENVVEFIAPVHVMSKLNLNEGDFVDIEI